MKYLRDRLPALLASGFLLLIVGIIGVSAYKPGTWLTGWDNLHPEFDFALNINRNFSSAWKDFQGLGAVSGVGLSSELPRQIILWILSVGIPRNQLRFVWTIALYALGGLGMYAVMYRHFLKKGFKSHAVALLAGTFYLLNLGAIQNFYTPFETFSTYFGFFPWLILAILQFLNKPSGQSIFLLVLSMVLIMPIAYVPTVFVVVTLCCQIFLTEHVLFSAKKLPALATAAVVILLFAGLNLHWLAPFGYYFATHGTETANLKINTFASVDARYSNAEYGRWQDVVLLRGFWFEYLDTPAQATQPQFLMQPWRDYFAHPAIPLIGYVFFAAILFGVFYAIKYKTPHWKAVVALFLISVFMLKTYNPPTGVLFSFLAQRLPVFGEIFRYAFTKWIVVAVFSYATLFAWGIKWLIESIEHLRLKRVKFNLSLLVVSAFLCLLIIYVFPLFSGQIFSRNNQLKIPDEYFQVMRYFKTQPKSARIATLPQSAFWGWDVHTWGYRGSGWWRHGIEQPLLERTHDVWAPENEQYYNEMSNAIYTTDLEGFGATVKKYHIGWLLIDNTLDYGNDKHIPQIKALAEISGLFDAPLVIGQLTIYPRKDVKQLAETFIESQSATPVSPLYSPLLRDDLLAQVGTYFSGEPSSLMSLLSKQGLGAAQRKDNIVTLQQDVSLPAGAVLEIPDFLTQEKVVPARIEARKQGSDITLRVTPLLPKIQIGTRSISPEVASKEFAFPLSNEDRKFLLALNDNPPIPLEDLSENFKVIDEQYVFTQQANTFGLFASTPSSERNLRDDFFNAKLQNCSNQPGQIDQQRYDDKSFSYSATKAVGCSSLLIPGLITSQLIEVRFETKSSTTERPLLFIKDTATQQVLNSTFSRNLDFNPDWKTYSSFIQMPNDASPSAEVVLGINAADKTDLQKVYYRNVQLRQFEKIGSTSFAFRVSDSEGQKKIVQIDQPIETITTSVPVIPGENSAFYTAESKKYLESTKNCDLLNPGEHQKWLFPDRIQYSARNASECDAWDLTQVPSYANSLLEISSKHIEGKPLQMCLSYSFTGRCEVFEALPDNTQSTTTFYPVFAKSERNGSYVLQINNQSIGRATTINELEKLSMYPFPLKWLRMSVVSVPTKGELSSVKIVKTKKMHPSLYFAEIENNTVDSLISLSQTYDDGWRLYSVPQSRWGSFFPIEFLGIGRQGGDHLKVNSWQNGWLIEKPTHQGSRFIAILFWPYVLQFLGWLSLVTTLFAVAFYLFTRRYPQR